jgi:hypothetical protein
MPPHLRSTRRPFSTGSTCPPAARRPRAAVRWGRRGLHVVAGGKVYLDPVQSEVTAFAPATVANLGPGFDWLGCAVEVGVGSRCSPAAVLVVVCCLIWPTAPHTHRQAAPHVAHGLCHTRAHTTRTCACRARATP